MLMPGCLIMPRWLLLLQKVIVFAHMAVTPAREAVVCT